jgi:protein-L-isoaspartate(D-aspartate) O-methyltransferase
MTQPLIVRLNWEGDETIRAIAPVLSHPCHIELHLAANYHHAIYRHFNPAAPPGGLEVLDEQGGAELLDRLAEIEGLRALAQLKVAVAESHGLIHVTDPAVVIIDIAGPAQDAGLTQILERRDIMKHRYKHMIDAIKLEARGAEAWVGKSDIDSRVLEVMAKVPRHEFVPIEETHAAYEDGPLPIGHGQTISQPYIVALMTELVQPEPGDVMLEVGTGSGYQAAVLSLLVGKVYSVEVVKALAEEAAARLKRLGYRNIETRWGDGYSGWPEHAPYDGIIVTAAAPSVPPLLVDQLKPGARLVVPVSSGLLGQDLLVVDKDNKGQVRQRCVLPVAFVPLVHLQEGPENVH